MRKFKKVVGIIMVMAMTMMVSLPVMATEGADAGIAPKTQIGAEVPTTDEDAGMGEDITSDEEEETGNTEIDSLGVDASLSTIADTPASTILDSGVTTVEFLFDPGDTYLSKHEFRAYQIFAGTQQLDPEKLPNEDGEVARIGDIVWGSGIKGPDFLAKLKTDKDITSYAGGSNPFTDCNNALDVAEVLQDYEGRYKDEPAVQRLLDQVARIAASTEGLKDSLLTNTYTPITAPVKDENGKYPADVREGTNDDHPGKLIKTVELAVGYYLIVDVTNVAGTDGVLNAAVLQPTTSLEISVKTSKPELEKKVLDGNNLEADTNNAAINDTVTFVITSHVPDMSHYDYYKFVVTDVLSRGLTFTGIQSVKITPVDGSPIDVTDKSVDDSTGYTYELTASDTSVADELKGEYAGGTALRIVFNNFYEKYMGMTGAEIKITYTAVLNSEAKVGSAGNPNEARLLYWNDPDVEGEGDDFTTNKEYPDPQGISPWKETYTFTTALRLTKVETVQVEGEDSPSAHPLTGAVFKITGSKLESSIVVSRTFEEDPNGSYYKLADGTYTLEKPTSETQDKYDDDTKKYKMVVGTSEDKASGTKPDVAYTTEVDEFGQILIVGLAEGDYLIEETKAPLGYNKLVNPIKVVISVGAYKKDEDSEKWVCEWNATQGEWNVEENEYVTGPNEIKYSPDIKGFAGGFAFNVENNRGALLPRTGGIGTTIFYVVGGILVVMAGVLLALKKRAGSNKD